MPMAAPVGLASIARCRVGASDGRPAQLTITSFGAPPRAELGADAQAVMMHASTANQSAVHRSPVRNVPPRQPPVSLDRPGRAASSVILATADYRQHSP